MNKNNPINSVYLLALALASLMFYVNSFYEALVFTVVVVAVFLFAISVVSMILLYWIFDVAGFKGFLVLKNKKSLKKTKIVKTT